MSQRLRLAVIDGPDDPIVGDGIDVRGELATLGRSPHSTCCLPDPSVSRTHARVRLRDERWFLVDTGSTTGTYINGLRLEDGVPAALSAGDEVVIGPWRFRVDGDQPAPAHTVALTTVSAAPSAHVPSRRLEALSRCIERLAHATDEEGLAWAACQSATEGTGFRRAAVLRSVGGARALGLVGGGEQSVNGWSVLSEEALQIPGAMAELALSGQTAIYTDQRGSNGVTQSSTLVDLSIHSAVCAPVRMDGRVAALLYLDSRGSEAPVSDATSFCEDVAQMYGLALACAARADLLRRQAAMHAELERARVLRAMLEPAEIVEGGRYRVTHRTVAGHFVSGDLFDVLPRDDGGGVILFGDAMGHGVGAAMLTALVHANLHAQVEREPNPAAALAATNRFIAERPSGGSFVSLWLGRVHPDGRVEFADAGHGHWLIARASGEIEHGGGATGIPLGIDPTSTFEASEVVLSCGDRIVIYTDGITEQRRLTGEAVGESAVRAVLRSSRGCADDVARIFELVMSAAADGGLEDDATVASIEYTGSEG